MTTAQFRKLQQTTAESKTPDLYFQRSETIRTASLDGHLLNRAVVDRIPWTRETVVLKLRGDTPSKKNRLRPRKGPGKGKMYDPAVKAVMDGLHWQVKAQWGDRPPVRHPALQFWIYAVERKDRDGIVTTLLDVLKTAGVLVDDSIKECNGLLLIHPALPSEVGGSQGAVIRIDFDPETTKCETPNVKPASSHTRRSASVSRPRKQP